MSRAISLWWLRLGLLASITGWVFAPGATAAPTSTPAPTVTVVTTSPVGPQPIQTVQANWQVAKPGVSASLNVQGVSAASTTVTALWTSRAMNPRGRMFGPEVGLAWWAGALTATNDARQTVRIRFGRSGHWGSWANLYSDNLATSATSAITGSGVEIDPFYDGPLPAPGLRVQVELVDVIPNPTAIIGQTLTIN